MIKKKVYLNNIHLTMEPFKNIYNQSFFKKFTKVLHTVIDDFNEELFIKEIQNSEWSNKELKQRIRHISTVLKNYLDSDYEKAVNQIIRIIEYTEKNQSQLAFEYLVIPDYIEQYGLQHLDTSIIALERITQYTTCEFAIRPYIEKYPEIMMDQMLSWSTHQHENVRRFSSEGCRPRLPWGVALKDLKNNPKPIYPILENLKNDTSEFVRKSVANNINDIAKDNPEEVIKIIKKWVGKTKNTDWICKHASRTLLKEGNPEVMSLFGLDYPENITIKQLNINTPLVKIGKALEFTLELENKNNSDKLLRLEYAIYYQKANGTLSKKVYKISEKKYTMNSITIINRKQSFKLITTRKLHIGLHQLSIIINGKEFDKHDFELIN